MKIFFQEKPPVHAFVLGFSRQRKLELVALFAVVLLAVALRFTNLESLGYVNHYYTAAVESMLQSWHNFFFVAAEPGGSVSVDKPPVGLWLQAISAYFLGVNGFSVLLPQLLAGIASILLLYSLVRRSFGITTGLIAAVALAVTPVVVATDRNNTIDSTLILALLFAAWAFIQATKTGKLRYLLLGAVLVGIGFNIKMLQAYLPLPAFFALYFLGAKEKVWPKAGKLALASVLLLVVSLSWAMAVDLTPADQRPYVGSSSHNSETDLILGYNGVNRLLGMFGQRNNGSHNQPATTQNPGQMPFVGPPPNRPGAGNLPFPQRPPNANAPQGSQVPVIAGQRDGGGGGMNIGQPGVFRLFIAPLNKEASWLLPFALVSAILLAIGSQWKWPLTETHQALVLWGGWLLICLVFFSVAGFFHEYYLSMLAAPLAAVVAMGINQLWQLAKRRRWVSIGILGLSAAGTLAFQGYTGNNFTQDVWWLPGAVVLLVVGMGLLVSAGFNRQQDSRYPLGFSLVVVAMLSAPGVWSALTNLSASQNQSLPSAYAGGVIGPAEGRDLRIHPELLDYLEANTQNVEYLLAVPSSMQGADYVLATGRPVLYMGGFNGQDQVVTAGDLSTMVANGALRFISWNTNNPGREVNSEITAWISSSCTLVQGLDTATPDGANVSLSETTSPFNGFLPNADGQGGDLMVMLYDCAATIKPATAD